MKQRGSPTAPRRRWRVVVAAALTLACAGGVSLYQQARRHDLREQAAYERRLIERLAQDEQRIRALEVERDLRQCFLERPAASAPEDPRASEQKGRRAEVDRELGQVEAEITELKTRMQRIPLSEVQAIPESADVQGARQAAAAAAKELSDLEGRFQPDYPGVERKRHEKEKLERALAVAAEEDLARRKNLAYKSLEDSLIEKVEAKKALEEERERLKVEPGGQEPPVRSSGRKEQAAMAALERDLAKDPTAVPAEPAQDDSSEFPMSVFLLGSLLGVVVALFAGGRDAEEEPAAADPVPPTLPHPLPMRPGTASSSSLRLDAGGRPIVG